jgi:hypothetical protein
MSNLTLRMDPDEKERLMAWAALRGTTATDYIKGLVAADMAAGSAEDRAAAWFHVNRAALEAEGDRIERSGIPGSHLALHHPWPDEEI